MSIKLHRCAFTCVHLNASACYRVQRALDLKGVDYGVVKEPYLPRSRRKNVERLSGQRLLPVIEFADGSVYREESAEMAATILRGELDAKRFSPSARAPRRSATAE